MCANTAAFEGAGFGHPDASWTKDDFYQIASAIASGGSDSPVYGYAWINRLWGSWMPWIFVNGGNILTEERAPGGEWLWSTFYADDPAAEGRGGGWRWLAPQANDPANVEALEFMVQLFDEGITPAVELGGGETLQGFFTSGTLAMTPAGGFWAGGLANAGMENGAFDVQLFPTWKNQRHQFGTGALFIFEASENVDAAWDYYKFSASRDAMEVNGIFNPVTLTTPSRRSMCNAERFSETGPEHWEVFYATLDDHPDTAPIPAPPISNPMTTIFTSYTARAMSLEMTPQEALDGMQKELEDLYSREGEGMYKL
ncbi:MAG: extracellular solute-binding protein [Caldilineaceae bacterium]